MSQNTKKNDVNNTIDYLRNMGLNITDYFKYNFDGIIMPNKTNKILIAVLFFVFIYKIIYHIGIFFGWNQSIFIMYMLWIAIIIIFISILPTAKSMLN